MRCRFELIACLEMPTSRGASVCPTCPHILGQTLSYTLTAGAKLRQISIEHIPRISTTMHSNSITIYSTALNSIHANILPLLPLLIHNEISILLCACKVYNGSMKTVKLCSIVAIHSALFVLLHDFTPPIFPILLILGSLYCATFNNIY